MRKINKIAWLVTAVTSFGLSNQAWAFNGYSSNVIKACATAGRPAPVIKGDDCSTCHTANRKSPTAAKTAFKNGGAALLDFFCSANNASTTNHPPTITAPNSRIHTATGGVVSFKVTAQDVDANDTLTLTAMLNEVPGASFDAATGQFVWTAGAAQSTPSAVTFYATDPAGLVASTVVSIQVSAASSGDSTANQAIAAVNFSQVKWYEHQAALQVSGVVIPIAKKRLPAELAVTLTNSETGVILGTPVRVSKNGRWSLVVRNLVAAPCQITAQIGGVETTAWVSHAEDACFSDYEDNDSTEEEHDGSDEDEDEERESKRNSDKRGDKQEKD